MDVSCHRPFLPGSSLEAAVIPTAQASSFTLQFFPYYVLCSKYSCICSESIEWFPGTASKFFLKLLVTILVAPIITGIIAHFRFHVRCISIHKLLYFNFFSATFCTTFLFVGIATSISVHVFSLFFLILISGLFAVTSLSVCTVWFHNTLLLLFWNRMREMKIKGVSQRRVSTMQWWRYTISSRKTTLKFW